MPEGDTVWLAAHRLDGALRDRPVTAFDLRVPQLATADLRGATVRGVLARGKHILMRFDTDQTLHSHLRMDGSWRVSPAARAPRVGFDVRAVIGNATWSCHGRRVHDLALAPTSEEAQWVGHLGPDLLGPDWDADRAVRNLLESPDRPVAEALLDQRTLAGIGNMYAAEILFVHRTRPTSPVAALPDPAATMATAYRLLRMNRDHTAQSTTGQTRRGEEHWVYLRTGQPCRRCRTPIESGEIGRPPQQRVTYWCPRCQPEA
ncbi:MAG: DNA-formamidopyrimidine glycosylase family protein [Jatrophihabitans sp.]